MLENASGTAPGDFVNEAVTYYVEPIMMTHSKSLLMAVLFFLSVNGVSLQAAEVTMFVNNALQLNFGDDSLAILLEDMGHDVTVIGHDVLPRDQLDFANLADLVIVSESVTSGNIGANLNDTETPIIVYEPFVFDDMDLTGTDSTTADIDFFDFGFSAPDQTDLVIINSDHPMAAGLPDGEVTVYEDSAIIGWGVPAESAEQIARPVDAEDSAAIFVYEKGDELFSGDTAAGMRIGFFLHNRTAEPSLLTAEGVALLQAAVDYAVGGGGDLPGDFNRNGELDIDDINLLVAELNGSQSQEFDVTGDGSVNQSDLNFWVKELKSTWIGDANLDGEFNSGDLVSVFQEGRFEAGQIATWDAGDWNGDTAFDSGDLVVAFQDGGWERGPSPAATAVPEPTNFAVILFAMVCGVSVGRTRQVDIIDSGRSR